MKYITHLVRIIVGIIFIISGFVKTIDPIGFSYKLEEYFGPGVFNIPILENFALPLSILFVILEVLVGVLLLLGMWKRLTVYLLLTLIVFFTFLTFYSAYFNKVTDCGCFGDALKLTPWMSFIKDIILLVMIIFLVRQIRFIKPFLKYKTNKIIVILSLILCIVVAYQGIAHLPIIDFRPYAVGKDLKKGMQDGSPQVESIVYTLENLKNKEEKRMTSDEYINSNIWADTLTWKIKNSDIKIIKEGVLPSVHDFIIDCGGQDRTESILEENKIVVITVPYAEKMSLLEKAKLKKIISDLKVKRLKYVLMANDPQKLRIPNACISDQTTIKTINRSNPGFMVLKKGIVVAKYHGDDFPSLKKIEKL
ncbi:DoxX family membrane protein [Apibacter muscae]|uniref:DoxX family membrane protein n=1 Tax=Apibacter muscae TaxID=2509004 RepID=A0A563D913_9FLAO|nr:BT_3928 family protein [Apibacter muscae]TWP26572.1 DoxX family membrane protein [Apibacter muscae]TWP28146.1 DoxX family membrane protein [Apibacter muscae]